LPPSSCGLRSTSSLPPEPHQRWPRSKPHRRYRSYPKDGALFVGVGSSGNIGVEPAVKASIQRFNADGSNQATFASGLRNATYLAFNPVATRDASRLSILLGSALCSSLPRR
jgi:hypothetical protein